MVFQEIAAGGGQQVTSLWDAVFTTTENLPPETGNSVAAITDTNDTPTLAEDDVDILFKAIRRTRPEVAAALV